MVTRARYVAAALLILSANLVDSAGAEEEKIKRITPTDADSACIGNPVTPLCAVETWIACHARDDLSLCRAVGQEPDWIKPGRPPWTYEYVVERVHKIRPEDVTEELKDTDWFRPGYFDIRIKERSCPPPQTTCPGETWFRYDYSVKPVGGLWHMVAWSEEGAGS
jgi:hypothetical protein